ncbi:hypothetical protein A0H81_02794 [Grifola frondosa]|uniref:Uncharacterized protein n=1 Tax=Grifola frondosa TaxID=5627 RepID=A0A1C7MKD5_GRIFR|nr:hypothetical protein A0H81_02794 [Grifola frondosa]
MVMRNASSLLLHASSLRSAVPPPPDGKAACAGHRAARGYARPSLFVETLPPDRPKTRLAVVHMLEEHAVGKLRGGVGGCSVCARWLSARRWGGAVL